MDFFDGDNEVFSRLFSENRNILGNGDSIPTGWISRLPEAGSIPIRGTGVIPTVSGNPSCITFSSGVSGLGPIPGCSYGIGFVDEGDTVSTGSLTGFTGLGPGWVEIGFNDGATIEGGTDWFGQRLLEIDFKMEVALASGIIFKPSDTIVGKIIYRAGPNCPNGMNVTMVSPYGGYPYRTQESHVFNAFSEVEEFRTATFTFPAVPNLITNGIFRIVLTPTASASRVGAGEKITIHGAQIYATNKTGAIITNASVGGSQIDNWKLDNAHGLPRYFQDAETLTAWVGAFGFDTLITQIGVNGGQSYYTPTEAVLKVEEIFSLYRAGGIQDCIACNYYGMREKDPEHTTDWRQIFPLDNNPGVGALAWNASAKTLTASGAFTNYAFVNRYEYIYVPGGSGVTSGYYQVVAATANSVTLAESISATDTTTDAGAYIAFGYFGTVTDAWLEDYGDALRVMADAHDHTAFVDFREACGDPHAFNMAYLGDGTHPSTPFGQMQCAKVFSDAVQAGTVALAQLAADKVKFKTPWDQF